MDDGDIAADLEQRFRDLALKNALDKVIIRKPSLKNCIDCDADIEPDLKTLGGAKRCKECKGYHEKEKVFKGLRFIRED